MQVIRRPYEINFAGNPVVYGLYDDTAVGDTDARFEVQVYMKHSGNADDFTLLATATITPVAGRASIDISSILDANLHTTVPDIAAAFTEATTQTGYFFIAFRRAALSGGLNNEFDGTEIEYTRRVVAGGIAPYQWKHNNFWINYYKDRKPFLTWQQTGRLAGAKERLFLAWLNDTTVPGGSIRINCVVAFADNIITEVNKPLPAAFNRVYYIAADLSALGVVVPPGKTVFGWSITVQDNSIAGVPVNLSETFSFLADNRNNYNDLVLHYRNSLGGFDSVRVRGEIEHNVTLTGADVELSAGVDWPFNGSLPAFNRSLPHVETSTFKADIGYLAKEEQDRLRDIFLNRECYRERYGRWWPVKPTVKQYRKGGTADKLFNLPIEFEYCDGGSYYYTPAIDLGAGKNLSNTCQAKLVGFISSVNYDTVNSATVTWMYNVENPGDEIMKSVQWRVPGFVDEWQDAAYPPNQVKTTHAVPGQYTVDFRGICTEGSAGAIVSQTINIPLSGEPPTPVNSHVIYAGAGRNNITITRNGVMLYTGQLYADTSFHCPDGLCDIEVLIPLSVQPSASLTSNGGTVPGARTVVGIRTYFRWTGINVLNGIVIKIPA